MPAGSASRKRSIRRAISNEAIALNVQALALCLPGDTGTLAKHELQLVREELVVVASPLPDEQGGAEADADDARDGGEYGRDMEGSQAVEVDMTWLASSYNIDEMLARSMMLGQQHFPQLDQQPPSAEAAAAAMAEERAGRRRAAMVACWPMGASKHVTGLQFYAGGCLYCNWVREERCSDAVPALSPAGSTQAPQANNRSVAHIDSTRVRDKFQQKWQAAKDNFFRPIKEVGWLCAPVGYHRWHGPNDSNGLQALGSTQACLDDCQM